MGLLERAEKLSAQDKKKKSGLLNRLNRLKNQFSTPQTESAAERSESPKSLLRRAMELREQAEVSPEHEREGLLEKASRLKESAVQELQSEIRSAPFEEKSLPVESGELPLSETDGMDSFPLSDEQESFEASYETDGGSEFQDESYADSDFLENLQDEKNEEAPDFSMFAEDSPPEEAFPDTKEEGGHENSGIEPLEESPDDELADHAFQEEVPEAETPESSSDEIFSSEIPEFQYEGNSAPESDPALEQEEEEFISDDPFDRWVEEAKGDAEEKAGALARPGSEIASTPSQLLYDQESGFSTEPEFSKIREQRKIEHFMSLIEISREIAATNDMETLLDNTLFSIVGEIGAETACILIPEDWDDPDSPLRPITYTGFEPEEEWIFRKGETIYETVHKKDEILYAEFFKKFTLTKSEKKLLETLPAEHLKPMYFSNKFRGVIVFGKSLSGEEYTISELEFLKYLSDLTAAGVDRIVEFKERLTEREDLKKRKEMNDRIFSLARNTSKARNLDDIYDLLADSLEYDYKVSSYSLVLLSTKEHRYRIFGANKISTESMEKFSLATHSDLVGLISSLTRVHELRSFRDNSDVVKNYTGDDIALMKHFWLVPLVNLNWLVGFIAIHEVSEEWTSFHREMIVSLAEVMSPIIANHLILSEKDSLFKDPFSPLEEKLKLEIANAREFSSNVSLCVMRIRNMKRIISLNKHDDISNFFGDLNKFLPGYISENDLLSRMGQGVYALVLSGRNHEESEIFMNKLKAEIKRKNFLSESPVEVNFSIEISSYPDDADRMEKMISILD
ncbi:MAG: diguanylate cyclase [Spirochaetia bacterium]|nr:diguanylate cyclase [Spirochaetia bacterium]